MKILFDRDSVCMADDIESHEETFDCADDIQAIEQILKSVSARYLPSIAGGKATWVVSSKLPIAVIAQQWSKPKLLPKAKALSSNFFDIDDGTLRLYFRYCTQKNPDDIWSSLSQQPAE